MEMNGCTSNLGARIPIVIGTVQVNRNEENEKKDELDGFKKD
jgi:hypothetical protein